MLFNQFLDGRAHVVRSRPVAVLLAWLVCLDVALGAPAAPERAAGEEMEAEEPSPLKEIVWKTFLYLPNRAADFVDCVRLNVGVGLGALANVRPTKSLQAGIGAYDTVRFGLRGRRWPFWHEWSLEGGFDGMYQELGETERGFYEFGGTVHVLIVGLDAAIDIEEVLDFGFGVFMSDPADDDYR